jgi:hypothetical protein
MITDTANPRNTVCMYSCGVLPVLRAQSTSAARLRHLVTLRRRASRVVGAPRDVRAPALQANRCIEECGLTKYRGAYARSTHSGRRTGAALAHRASGGSKCRVAHAAPDSREQGTSSVSVKDTALVH